MGLALCACAASPGPAAAAAGGTAPAGTPSAPAGAVSPSSSLHVTSVRILAVSCVPYSRCSGNPRQVSTHGTLLFKGKGLKSGMTVAYPKTPGARISSSSPASHLHAAAAGLIATVPANAHSGHIMVVLAHGRHTSSYGPIYVYRHALHPPPVPLPPFNAGAAGGSAFSGQGMWIWYMSDSEAGSVAAIVAQAHAAQVGTLFIKSSDGASNYWSQFSPQLVAELHANGLKACAWQYVYGTNPVGEAELGAQAAADGADCLVIDAESEYEGRYAAAQTYIDTLRAKIGPNYPLALASFPYVSYHPTFPYSVFLGPGGAQYNAPQMYWHDIGDSVDTTFANTYAYNKLYGRPILPLGQVYNNPPTGQVFRFRQLSRVYGARNVSWWDWQDAAPADWVAISRPAG